MRAYSMRCMTLHLRAVNRNNMPRMRLAILPARLGDSESVNSGPGPSRSSALHKALSLPLSVMFFLSLKQISTCSPICPLSLTCVSFLTLN